MGLLRTDDERVRKDGSDEQNAHLPVEDWIREPDSTYFKIERGLKRVGQWYPAMYRTLGLAPPIRRLLYTRMARHRLDRGIRQLGKAHAVRTDRLHAFILCRLMNIEVETGDNSYGKIAAFRSTWGL
jgi:pyruvyl transferase EpsO